MGVLSGEAVKYLALEVRDVIAKDEAIGEGQARQLLFDLVKGELAHESIEWRSLESLTDDLEPGYLERWCVRYQSGGPQHGPERCARAIAAHLLDLGFSADYLESWWSARFGQTAATMADVLTEMSTQLSSAPLREFEVLVPVSRGPRRPTGTGWLSSQDVPVWINRACGVTPKGRRQHGGLVFNVRARDATAAARRGRALADAVVARFAVGSSHRLTVEDTAWVAGSSDPFTLSWSRGVSVRALERENRLLEIAVDSAAGVDASLYLLGPLEHGPPSTAVTSGWAAIEATLTMPGDRGTRARAADHLATLVACSWPRAELTSIARSIERNRSDPLAAALLALTTNKEKASLLLAELVAARAPDLGTSHAAAALARMTAAIARPGLVLRDVQQHVTRAFRRLYRQRNLLVHGGHIDAVALDAALRVGAPLVGAGFDRIAHAVFVEGTPPAALVTRASVRLRCLSDTRSSGSTLIELLEG
jgi:hypothetical protein